MPEETLKEPWLSFLHDLDARVDEPTELHCLGGFVIAELYDFDRVTVDVDVIEVRGEHPAKLTELAGKGKALHRRHKVYLDIVTVATLPENYEARLQNLARNEFKNLTLKALEKHDLVLAKLTRNIDRDREDVKRLAIGPGLDPSILRERYHSELRWQLGQPAREDLTLNLWLEMIDEITTVK